jgi:hypothetical protein
MREPKLQMERAELVDSPGKDTPLTTAVLFVVFNRPEVTQRVFAAIRTARPLRLYIAADGPRANVPADGPTCAATRAITSAVDWPCTVSTLFRETNLGCRAAVSSAVTWFFQHEEEGIILEDDCLPTASFFTYCQILLEAFREDRRVGHIAGTAFFQKEAFPTPTESFVFSRYGSIWGWATWRRAWDAYDVDITKWSLMLDRRWLLSAYPDASERRARLRIGERLVRRSLDTWDFQWTFARNFNSMLSIVPTKNLVVNIGFGADATHTTLIDRKAPTGAEELTFPLVFPPFILADAHHDQVFIKRAFKRAILSKAATAIAFVRRGLRRRLGWQL